MNINSYGLGAPNSNKVDVGSVSNLLNIVFAIAVFFSLFSLAGGDAVQADGGSSTFRQVSWLFVALITFLSSFRLGRVFFVNLSINVFVLIVFALLIYCLASCFWSELFFVTLKRALLFSIMVFLCFFTFCPKDAYPAEYLLVLARPVGLLILLSFLLAVISPASAISSVGWRGVTSFKNEFGQLCAVGVLIFFYGILEFKRKVACVFFLGLSVLGLILSKSSTCIVAVMLGMSLSVLYLMLKKSRSNTAIYSVLISLLLVLCIILLTLFVFGYVADVHGLISGVFGLLGKSTNLTGRTNLWLLIDDNLRLHNKWFGGGYGGFWDGLGSPAGFTAYRFPGGYVGQAHNGYLDILNDLGYIGILFLVLVLLGWLISIFFAEWNDGYERYFHFALFIYVIVMNCAESTFFRLVVFLNIIFFASVARSTYKFIRTVK